MHTFRYVSTPGQDESVRLGRIVQLPPAPVGRQPGAGCRQHTLDFVQGGGGGAGGRTQVHGM